MEFVHFKLVKPCLRCWGRYMKTLLVVRHISTAIDDRMWLKCDAGEHIANQQASLQMISLLLETFHLYLNTNNYHCSNGIWRYHHYNKSMEIPEYNTHLHHQYYIYLNSVNIRQYLAIKAIYPQVNIKWILLHVVKNSNVVYIIVLSILDWVIYTLIYSWEYLE